MDGKNGNNKSDRKNSQESLNNADRLLPPRGDYQTLLSFQKAEVIYDITFRFAHKFLSKGDRTIDQMVQAARSGKKNILEGSKAALMSKETEIKLTNVARASLEELLDDYGDYLRVRDLPIWDKKWWSARAHGSRTHQASYESMTTVEIISPIPLIHPMASDMTWYYAG